MNTFFAYIKIIFQFPRAPYKVPLTWWLQVTKLMTSASSRLDVENRRAGGAWRLVGRILPWLLQALGLSGGPGPPGCGAVPRRLPGLWSFSQAPGRGQWESKVGGGGSSCVWSAQALCTLTLIYTQVLLWGFRFFLTGLTVIIYFSHSLPKEKELMCWVSP